MQPRMQAFLRAALAVLLTSGGLGVRAGAQDPRSGLDPVTSAVMGHPITTSSAAARGHFLAGQREFDLLRLIDANEHFKAAVAADPRFAFAYLNVALTANSTEEFKSNLAVEHLRQGDPFDPYVKYQLAVATEGSGDAARAKQLFREVANYNFNTLGFALVRKDAQEKASRAL